MHKCIINIYYNANREPVKDHKCFSYRARIFISLLENVQLKVATNVQITI